jgi:hypothetical protein
MRKVLLSTLLFWALPARSFGVDDDVRRIASALEAFRTDLQYAESGFIAARCELARARAALEKARGNQERAIKELHAGVNLCATKIKGTPLYAIKADSVLRGRHAVDGSSGGAGGSRGAAQSLVAGARRCGDRSKEWARGLPKRFAAAQVSC